MDIRVGNGYDVHQLADNLPLVLGGIHIPYEQGLVAHSDGDVLIHALCDAILGALALGDIGRHFPDNSDDYKGIDSRILLRRVCSMAAEKGYGITNVDCTVLAQKPKLSPYVEAMRGELAGVMGISSDRVSVKATTTEKLGFVGRCEGIAVYATALLQKSDD